MKFLKIFLTVIVLILTVVLCSIKPALHKSFVITGSDFKLERYSEKAAEKTVALAPKTEYKSHRDVKIEPSLFLNQEQKAVKTQPQTLPADETRQELQEVISDLTTGEEEPRQLTRREEMIAWNKWRSDLQNQIMLNANVAAPVGTFFYFSFTVDKFRHISNIKAYSTNPFFQNEVTEKLVPAIKNFEYTSMLEFPKGSAREKTKFKGMFMIGFETSLSTPGDFNDIERVNVYE